MSPLLSQEQLQFATAGRGAVDISADLQAVVAASGVHQGIALLFLHHTSASLLLCENADRQVLRDLEAWLARAAPDGDPLFRHTAEGADDMPAHVRAVLTGCSLSVPLRDGRLDLGRWQGIFLYEHRTAPHRRRVSVTVIGN